MQVDLMMFKKALVALLVLAFLPLLSVMTADGSVVNGFSGGVKEKTIYLRGTRSPLVDASLYFTIDPGVTVASAGLNISTVNSATGPWLSDVRIDFGLDQRPEWEFTGRGYGELGHQSVFSDDSLRKTIRITASGGAGTAGSIILPYGAEIISAEVNLTGRFVPESTRYTAYSTPSSSTPVPRKASPGNFDGDSKMDAAVVLDSTVYSYVHNSTGWHKISLTSGFNTIDAITTGDYDGDGDDDIAFSTPDSGKSGIYYLNNTASGTSFTQMRINGSFTAKFLVSADLDGDGRDEVVASLNQYSSNAIYLIMVDYNGTAWNSWVIGKSSSSDSSHTVYGIYPARINNDTWPDIVLYQTNSYQFYWFENPANTSFYSNSSNKGTNWTRHLAFSPSYGSPQRFAVGDVDSDGLDDIVTMLTGYRGSIYFHKNPGSSGTWSRYTVTSYLYYASNLAVGDIDDDGYADIVASYNYRPKRLVWFDSGGSPTSGSWTQRTIDSGLNNPSAFYVQDMDGDDDGDIILLEGTDRQVIMYENSGSGDGTEWKSNFVEVGSIKDYRGAKSVDFDGDGDQDIVVAVHGTGLVMWLENDGTPFSGSWESYVISPGRLSGATDVDVGDVDNDGDLDVVVALRGEGSVVLLVNPGNEKETFDAYYIAKNVVTVSYEPYGLNRVMFADLDKDGDLDVLFSIYYYYSAGLYWLQNSNPYSENWLKSTIHSGSYYYTGFDVGDIDKDGDNDVVFLYGGYSGTISWAVNPKPVGQPTGSWAVKPIGGGLYYPQDVELYDIDGDGNLDAVVTDTYRNSIKWFHCPPNPLFASSWNVYVLGTGVTYPWRLNVADVGEDGYPDVVVTSNYPWSGSWAYYGVKWFEMNDSPFTRWERHTLDTSTANTWDAMFVDLDNDSTLDVFFTSRNDNLVRLCRLNLVYPASPYIDVGSDNQVDWQYPNTLKGWTRVDLSQTLNQIVNSAPTGGTGSSRDSYGNLLYTIPITIGTSTKGKFTLGDIDIRYNLSVAIGEAMDITDLVERVITKYSSGKVRVYIGIYSNTPGAIHVSDLRVEYNTAPEIERIPDILIYEDSRAEDNTPVDLTRYAR
ncbi:MAG TPA: VCBS repeat-containing protein, partial [Euryarchaeota archaeon]|nr:VCBS repeat-containing protein [Euryarchaeota archaeon]